MPCHTIPRCVMLCCAYILLSSSTSHFCLLVHSTRPPREAGKKGVVCVCVCVCVNTLETLISARYWAAAHYLHQPFVAYCRACCSLSNWHGEMELREVGRQVWRHATHVSTFQLDRR
ncbi:hypothetical protein TRVL_04540 [Trypanosoma vivax]|nr:hypothetical protein TRVL_04540 [Trypanosoma vivax]